MKTIAASIDQLDVILEKIPAKGSINDGLAIQKQFNDLVTNLQKGTADVKATQSPFSEADSRAILAVAKAFGPTILHLLSNTITKKGSITSIPVPGISTLVREALKKLQANANAFEAALIAAFAASVKAEGQALQAQLDIVFIKAVAAYA
ncbi:hypothetical protein H0H81_011713 [Sphagnurus paluster]|uniref:Uncharacterized protein n=1 Tax=Sphagnurus paluster TaxID=117069 RepID=A0A9P7KJB6_9AGAR|nr:hypothetical protein H0H81_011713 [Sphagnurus paluster]